MNKHHATFILCGYRKIKRMQMKERTIERYQKGWDFKSEYSPVKTGFTRKFRGVFIELYAKHRTKYSKKCGLAKREEQGILIIASYYILKTF